MKMTLTTTDIARELSGDENANWSWEGAHALADYLEDYEESTGEEMELDIVAIRCDFSQYDSLQDWAKEYFGEWRVELDIDADIDDDNELDGLIRDYIQDRCTLIEFDGGIIVSSF